MSGIQNLGQKGSLPEDLVKIITTCGVQEVAFIFDSDWNDLSRNIKINTPVDTRPKCFFAAARNFKEYMRMLKNRGIMVEIFIGHILKNEADDKGLDDLLANTLQGREDELAKDMEFACNEKSGHGQYVDMYKVTTWNDQKLRELWNLHSHEKFAEQHKDVLKELPEFIFGRYAWKFDEEGKLVSALPFEEDEKFWIEVPKEDRNGNQKLIPMEILYTIVSMTMWPERTSSRIEESADIACSTTAGCSSIWTHRLSVPSVWTTPAISCTHSQNSIAHVE